MSVYYEVRGQRAIYRHDKDDNPIRVGITPNVLLRFESLSLDDAQSFASTVYRREGVICTIDEVSR